ncbi:DMT family transporter [Lapidilactobacillus bayanensis]|uniref:DMT family transporter n=1 Tax=Lapidilactobacillus bayanensis TaxID=2485998 RepID=UPI001CDD61F5|nr:DMT family transporter [Lapidilactobacillus bayanensis]
MQFISRKNFIFGSVLASVAAIMWGFSGVTVSMLFKSNPAMTPLWVCQVRMLTAAVIMLILCQIRGEHPLQIWHDRQAILNLMAYAFLGLIPVQYCYFKTVEYGNAPIATILQFLGPFVITLYYSVFKRQRPTLVETIGLLTAFLGTLLIVTHGHLTQLAVAPVVIFWGVLSAIGVAANALTPRKLIPKYGALSTTGWGMLIAGSALNLLRPFWQHKVPLTGVDIGLLLITILIGTVIAFIVYATSLLYILPTTATLLDAFEPLSATFFAVLLVHTHLQQMDFIGGILIILAVVMITSNLPALFSKLQRHPQSKVH